MKVRIYVSPKTADTLWIKQSMRAISSEIMQKRYTPVFLEATDPEKLNFDEIYEPGERRLLIYAGASAAITPRLLSRFSECGVHGIFINYESSVLSGRYSKIFLDYRDGMRKIINYLTAAGRSEFALYGINPNSATDLIKDSFFCEYLRRDGKNPTRDIYYNYASLTGCFSRFCENCARYDAVICANDVVAVSLISHLREVGVAVPEDLYVVSFGSSVLASLSAPTITSVIVDHAELGGRRCSPTPIFTKIRAIFRLPSKWMQSSWYERPRTSRRRLSGPMCFPLFCSRRRIWIFTTIRSLSAFSVRKHCFPAATSWISVFLKAFLGAIRIRGSQSGCIPRKT